MNINSLTYIHTYLTVTLGDELLASWEGNSRDTSDKFLFLDIVSVNDPNLASMFETTSASSSSSRFFLIKVFDIAEKDIQMD